MILSLMAFLWLSQAKAQGQEMNDYLLINGKKLVLSDKKIFKYEDGQNYALHNGEFYPVEKRELNIHGPVASYFYITTKDGSEYPLSNVNPIKISFNQPREGNEEPVEIKLKEHPDSKPFIRYKSPGSGLEYKFYDLKVTPEGRIIPEKEFQSYKGHFTYIKKIDGGDYAMDTAIIKPPTEASIKAVEAQKKDFLAQIGNPMKAFKTVDLNGQQVESVDFLGKVVVINFWFIACPPCQQEIPYLNELKAEYENRDDIVFLGFATDSKERLDKFLEKKDFNFQIIPRSFDIANKFLVSAYPTNFVIDKEGNITYAFTGLSEHTIEEIKTAITKAID